MSAYLDASVLVPALRPEPSTHITSAYFRRVTQTVIVSDLVAAEVSSAMSRLVRTGTLSQALGEQSLAAFDVLRATFAERVSVDPADIVRAEIIVRRFDLMLKAPDAIHIAVAQRLGATLVTLDRRLAASARALGWPVDIPA